MISSREPIPIGRMIKAENCVARSRLCVLRERWQLMDAASLEKLRNDEEALCLLSDALSCEVPQLSMSLPRMPTFIDADLLMENGDLEDKGCVSFLDG